MDFKANTMNKEKKIIELNYCFEDGAISPTKNSNLKTEYVHFSRPRNVFVLGLFVGSLLLLRYF